MDVDRDGRGRCTVSVLFIQYVDRDVDGVYGKCTIYTVRGRGRGRCTDRVPYTYIIRMRSICSTWVCTQYVDRFSVLYMGIYAFACG